MLREGQGQASRLGTAERKGHRSRCFRIDRFTKVIREQRRAAPRARGRASSIDEQRDDEEQGKCIEDRCRAGFSHGDMIA